MTVSTPPAPSAQFAPDLPVHEVQARLDALIQPTHRPGPLPLAQALGRVLAADVVAPLDVPPHHNSAMDGYALDGAQLQPGQALTLQVAGTRLAGHTEAAVLASGQCLRIMTGAALPEGLDTVVPVELATLSADGSHITIAADRLRAGANRRLRGEDLQAGQVALARGSRITPAALGLLASLGQSEVLVQRRLQVAIFSTGDEILSLGDAPREGAVYDSNRYSLLGLLNQLGAEVLDLGAIPDDPQQLRAAFAQAAGCDAILTSGGVGPGAADHTKALLRELGDAAFWRIAMRPGRPMAVGRLRPERLGADLLDKLAASAYTTSASSYQKQSEGPWLFGLPGNPVATMVSFLVFVRPALQRLMGHHINVNVNASVPLRLPARCTQALDKRPGRTEYQRAVASIAADGQLQVRATGAQGSGLLHSMVQANALIVLEHDQGPVAAGDTVGIWLLDSLGASAP